ncbi:hypothetical protein E2562_010981 [Oryza meyeriana var. granulata]|uniref:ABC transmembrane type-1 domain-containing protein n=1 Tax=Oryza meyeriana var. granulata TaxID=110450 RepID=A0A6G1BUL2_9ORYZ|nr:hypothetical protein E2562_010981 [Oryza meyeriana var. granulata]
MGKKVGKLIQLLVMFLGGFAVAFTQEWLLTLVMLATILSLVLAGAKAAIVASFTREKQVVAKYNRSLKSVYSSGVSVQESLAAGVGMGTVMMLLFCGYSLGIWYGAKLILEKGYTGAQASPSMKAFAGGQPAAYKMLETINREPMIDAYNTTVLPDHWSSLVVDTTSSLGRCSTLFGREGIQLNGKAVDPA